MNHEGLLNRGVRANGAADAVAAVVEEAARGGGVEIGSRKSL